MAQNLGGEGSDGAVTWDSDGQGEKCHVLPHVPSLQYQRGRKSLSLLPALVKSCYFLLETQGAFLPDGICVDLSDTCVSGPLPDLLI